MRIQCSTLVLFLVSISSVAQWLPRPENYLIYNPRSAAPRLEWIPASAFTPLPPDTPRPTPQVGGGRTHPEVRRWIAQKAGTERVRVLVTLDEDLPPIVLPALKPRTAPDGAENAGIILQRRQALEQRAAQRQRRHAERLAHLSQATLLESFPAVNVMHVDLPVAAIESMLADPAVRYIRPATPGEPPPQSVIADGRRYIASDWWSYTIFPRSNYRNVPWERIALLDTGVRQSHDLLFTSVAAAYDCVNSAQGTFTCTTPAPGRTLNPFDTLDHGTASANIISGDAAYGEAYKGVSPYRINSYKVYDDTSGGLDPAAVLRAFTATMIYGDHIIVAEMQAIETQDGPIAQAADVAVSQGQTVIAAMGNGPLPGANDSLPRSPAVARKALGIGAVDMLSGQLIAPQSHGPSPDGRLKPDVLFPANVLAASSASNSAIRTTTFNDTSCATAFAGGAAGILYNLCIDSWIPQQYAWHHEYPGLIYSWAIMQGRRSLTPDNQFGAGAELFASSWCQSGEQYPIVDDGPNSTVDGEVTFSPSNASSFDFQISDNWLSYAPGYGYRCQTTDGTPLPSNTVDAVIWWEESATYPHIDFNLFLFDENMLLKATSQVHGSVFQKIHFTGDFSANQYDKPLTVRVIPRSFPDHEVRVHVIASLARW